MIYKTSKGFDLFTNFSKKIILNKKNIYYFLNKKNVRKKNKNTDLFIGFFGYELLNNLIVIKRMIISNKKTFLQLILIKNLT